MHPLRPDHRSIRPRTRRRAQWFPRPPARAPAARHAEVELGWPMVTRMSVPSCADLTRARTDRRPARNWAACLAAARGTQAAGPVLEHQRRGPRSRPSERGVAASVVVCLRRVILRRPTALPVGRRRNRRDDAALSVEVQLHAGDLGQADRQPGGPPRGRSVVHRVGRWEPPRVLVRLRDARRLHL